MTFRRRILIIEDDAFTGALMQGALTNVGFDTELAPDAVAGKKQLLSFDPDVVLVDIDLGLGPTGIDFIQMVRKARPDVAPILLSKHVDTESAGLKDSLIPEGVAYLRKSLVHDVSALVEAINEATRGHTEGLRQDRQSKGPLDLLTTAQREILHMMALGLSNKEIAKQRGVSVSNVEQRITEIFKTFGIAPSKAVVSRVEAVRRYVAITGIPER